MRSGHKCGKSTLAVIAALWFACCFPRARAILTATTGRQVRDVLWGELLRVVREAKLRGVDFGARAAKTPAGGMRWEDGREIIGFSTDKTENMAGYSGPHVLWVIDEASGFDEKVFEAIDGNAQSGARIFAISNPTQTAGFFYDAFHLRAAEWERFKISAEEAAAYVDRIPGLSRPDEVEARIKRYGRNHPTVRVRVLGEFPSAAANTIVSLHAVEQAQERWRVIVSDALAIVYGSSKPAKVTAAVLAKCIGIEHGPLEIGVDVARFGDDDTVITPRRGKFTFPQIVVHGFDSIEVAGMVLKAAREHQTPHEKAWVKVDGIGYGSGVVDQLRAAEIVVDGISIKPRELVQVVDVNVAETADDPERYPNLRSQLWFAVAEYLEEGGTLPPGEGDEEGILDAELMTPTYKIDPAGRQVVEPKADIKKRMNRSPDRADSVSLAVYRSRRPRGENRGGKKSSAGGGYRFGEGARGYG